MSYTPNKKEISVPHTKKCIIFSYIVEDPPTRVALPQLADPRSHPTLYQNPGPDQPGVTRPSGQSSQGLCFALILLGSSQYIGQQTVGLANNGGLHS